VRAVVLQSNYLPWKGYFDLIASADVFVIYDSVQYTKNDWRNRNRLMTRNGPVWITVSVVTAGRFGQKIRETEISDRAALTRHWKTITQTYGSLSGFADHAGELFEAFNLASNKTHLHDVNVILLQALLDVLRVETEIIDDLRFSFDSDDPTSRLVQICTELGVSSYLTGPAGTNYLDLDQFRLAEIAVEVLEYDHYNEYPQLGSGRFDHAVSIVDLLAHTGADGARRELRGRTHRAC